MPRTIRALFVTLFTLTTAAAAEEAPIVVAKDKQISLEYTLKLDDGTVADSNEGGQPLVYTQGAGQILPALDEAMLGMKVGDTKKVDLAAAQGYGEVDPQLFQTVPASAVPEDARKAGVQLMAQTQQGAPPRPVRVHEVKGEEIVMDFNHPLAGQDLHFEVKILAIE